MKKKIFALLMAMVLVLGMSTTAMADINSPVGDNSPTINSPTGDNEPELPEVRELTVQWSKTSPWTIEAENVVVGDEDWDYDYCIYKDGEEVWYDYVDMGKDDVFTIDISYYVAYNGEGKYTVEVFPCYVDGENGWVYPYHGTSEARTYTKPETQLATPANLVFDKETSKLTFDAVEGAARYEVYVCVVESGVDYGKSYVTLIDAEEIADKKAEVVLEHVANSVTEMEEGEYYKKVDFEYSVQVIAISDDIDKVACSEFGKLVLFENKLSKEQAKENFDDAFEAMEDENPDPGAALNALRGTSNETIVELLKTDVEFAKKVEKLDEFLVEAMGDSYKGSTSETNLVDATKVSVVGLAINGVDAYEEVELTFTEPEEKAVVPAGYEKGVQLDISLLVDDWSIEILTVPVTITMPIPTGVEKENLVILHYHGNAKEPEVLVPTVNEDGTMTFIVSGFSTFVVTNEVVEEAPAPTPTPEKPAPEAPKTGDTSGTALVCSLLFLAAGVVLVMKRNSFAK